MLNKSDGLVAVLTPTISTSAYAAGDVVGAPLEIVGAAQNTKGLAILRTAVVLDKSNQKVALDILFFDQDPGSVGADNAALTLSSTQLDMLVGRLSVAAGDYTTLTAATNAEATKLLELMLPTKAKSTSLWVLVVSRGTPTYATTSSLSLKLIMERL